jgi:hypothetical protein
LVDEKTSLPEIGQEMLAVLGDEVLPPPAARRP